MNLLKPNGPLLSTAHWGEQQRQDAEVFYHHREKAECALVAMSSWYGGDVFEFGSHDLCTGRNILTAVHLSGMAKAYKDTRFYFFDAFGKFPADMGEHTAYFKPYSDQGDQLELHKRYIREHGLYVNQCHLMQGLFQNTLTQEFKDTWQKDAPTDDVSETALHLAPEHRNPKQREIGFASIDCNLWPFYKTVLEFIFDMLAPNSYCYLDEALQSPEVINGWQLFCEALRKKRNLGCIFVRNAGGFGALYRIYPLTHVELGL